MINAGITPDIAEGPNELFLPENTPTALVSGSFFLFFSSVFRWRITPACWQVLQKGVFIGNLLDGLDCSIPVIKPDMSSVFGLQSIGLPVCSDSLTIFAGY